MKNGYILSSVLMLILSPGIQTLFAQDCSYDYTTDDGHPFTIVSNIIYSNPDNPPSEWTCEDTALNYDVYYPSDYDFSTQPPLPAIFMIHGGGFYDGSNKNAAAPYCEEFVSRNFIAINIEYRTGRNNDPSCHTGTMMFAVYRAMQDVKGAIRKVVADQKSDTPPFYRIDQQGLHIGGTSAGAITALNVAYYNQKDMDKTVPGVSSCIGGINDTTHYLPKNNKAKFKIKGVFSVSGALFKSLTSVKAGDPPVILFHGEDDHVVHYNFEEAPWCSTPDLSPGCSCPGFVMPSGTINAFGSDSIDFRFKQLGICYEFYHDDGAHLLSGNDFGLGTSNTTIIRDYVVERACCFFKSIRCGTCSSDPAVVDFDDEVNNNCDGYGVGMDSAPAVH